LAKAPKRRKKEFKKMLRVVFMGTPEFSVSALEKLHQKHSIVGVYTQPDKPTGRGLEVKFSPVKSKALELGLPVLQPEKLSAPGEFEKLSALKPDIIVVVAYGQILKRNVLDLPRLGCVNIHSSLLPRWRGAAPIQWAILKGDQKTGITTMRLVEKLDAGDILEQATTPISSEDTASSIHDRLSQMGAELILSTLEGLDQGTLKGIVQNESEVIYAAKLTKEMEWLDPEESAQNLDYRIRALNPWPGTSLNVGQRLKIKQARVRSDISGPKGQIFERAGMILLGTQKGCLELQSLQWDGKKAVDPVGFLNGLQGRGASLPLDVKSSEIQ
jgi:methionyl-tRNA formyltransferase